MLKLKLQYFGHLMQRVDSLEKTLMLGGIGGRRRRGRQRMRWLDDITDSMDVSLGELWELVTNREAWRAVIHGATKSRTRLSDWTELNWGKGVESVKVSCHPWNDLQHSWQYWLSFSFGSGLENTKEDKQMWSWVYILAGPTNIKHNKKGTSLMVQWLRLYTPNAEGSSSIPSQGTRSHMPQLKIPHTTIKTWCS